mmetsp:Transcript_12409/g.31737  ORF Transcript_12409/g.31737 Transcript_12409/m.31737 type:complete len:213 (+) Transcript_12409:128-766(+)
MPALALPLHEEHKVVLRRPCAACTHDARVGVQVRHLPHARGVLEPLAQQRDTPQPDGNIPKEHLPCGVIQDFPSGHQRGAEPGPIAIAHLEQVLVLAGREVNVLKGAPRKRSQHPVGRRRSVAVQHRPLARHAMRQRWRGRGVGRLQRRQRRLHRALGAILRLDAIACALHRCHNVCLQLRRVRIRHGRRNHSRASAGATPACQARHPVPPA